MFWTGFRLQNSKSTTSEANSFETLPSLLFNKFSEGRLATFSGIMVNPLPSRKKLTASFFTPENCWEWEKLPDSFWGQFGRIFRGELAGCVSGYAAMRPNVNIGKIQIKVTSWLSWCFQAAFLRVCESKQAFMLQKSPTRVAFTNKWKIKDPLIEHRLTDWCSTPNQLLICSLFSIGKMVIFSSFAHHDQHSPPSF